MTEPTRRRRRTLLVIPGTVAFLAIGVVAVKMMSPVLVNVTSDLAPHASTRYPFRLDRATDCRVVMQVLEGEVEFWITADPAPPSPPTVVYRWSRGEGEDILPTLPAGAHLVQVRNASASRRAQVDCKVIRVSASK
jgi:hypothetical protein